MESLLNWAKPCSMDLFSQFVLVVGDYHIPTRASNVPEQFKEVLVPGRMKHVLCTGNLTSSAQLDELKKLAPSVHCVRGDYDEVLVPLCAFPSAQFIGVDSGAQESSLPEETVIVVGGFRIGLVHGHQVSPWGNVQALAQLQRRMDVDVLVSGHTHQQSVLQFEVGCIESWAHEPFLDAFTQAQDKLFVNPGSITGAFTTTGEYVFSVLNAQPPSRTLLYLCRDVKPSFLLFGVKEDTISIFIYEVVDGERKVTQTEFKKPSS